MWYYATKVKEKEKELLYQIYVTETLYHQGRGEYLTTRFMDLLTPQKIDKRTGDEIAAEVIAKAGLIV